MIKDSELFLTSFLMSELSILNFSTLIIIPRKVAMSSDKGLGFFISFLRIPALFSQFLSYNNSICLFSNWLYFTRTSKFHLYNNEFQKIFLNILKNLFFLVKKRKKIKNGYTCTKVVYLKSLSLS